MPIGFFTAVCVTPGTPALLGSAAVPAQGTITSLGVTTSAGVALAASTVSLQASPANTAGKSIIIGGPGMNVAALAGIGLMLLPGAITELAFSNGEFDLAQIYFDTDSVTASKEKVFVTVIG